MTDERHPGPSDEQQQKALACLGGGVGAGIAVGVVIGLTISDIAMGLGIGLAFGAGGGGVLASRYYGGDLQ